MAGTCRDSHFYYYGIKFALSAYATLFSILGLLILSVGIYAEVERQRHKTLEGIFLAPAVLLLLLGVTVFLVSFVGMVGSLRDNRTLLKFFWVLLLIFLTELLLIFIEIIFENKMNEVFHSNIQAGIRHYYDDLDFKNILDFVQEKFSCCGGDEFRDWEVNQYHSCNGSGALACGVPHSCCIHRVPGGVVNTLCGYRTLDKEDKTWIPMSWLGWEQVLIPGFIPGLMGTKDFPSAWTPSPAIPAENETPGKREKWIEAGARNPKSFSQNTDINGNATDSPKLPLSGAFSRGKGKSHPTGAGRKTGAGIKHRIPPGVCHGSISRKSPDVGWVQSSKSHLPVPVFCWDEEPGAVQWGFIDIPDKKLEGEEESGSETGAEPRPRFPNSWTWETKRGTGNNSMGNPDPNPSPGWVGLPRG